MIRNEDPYYRHFVRCAGNEKTIERKDQWSLFVEGGLERGLFDETDVTKLSNIWSVISTRANAFGRKSDAKNFTFEKFQELLCREFDDSSKALVDAATQLPVECSHALKTSPEAVEEIFLIQNRLEHLATKLEDSALSDLSVFRMKGLFWNQIAPVAFSVHESGLDREDYRTFQIEHAVQILQQNTYVCVNRRSILTSMKSRVRVRDGLGLGLGLDRYGQLRVIVANGATSSESDGDERRRQRSESERHRHRAGRGTSKSDKQSDAIKVQIVLAPTGRAKGGRAKSNAVSSHVWFQLNRVQDAHRQLALSAHFVDTYGVLTQLEGNCAYVYEYVRTKPLGSILKRDGPFKESSALFRFWSGQILRALYDVHSQCSVTIRDMPTIQNVSIAMPGGERILLGHVAWGVDLRDMDEPYESYPVSYDEDEDDDDDDDRRRLSARYERQSLLVDAFATILREMLGARSPHLLHSRQVSVFGSRFRGPPVLIVTKDTLQSGCTLNEGEYFVLHTASILSVPLLQTAVWELTCFGEDESSGRPVVEIVDGSTNERRSWKASEASPSLHAARSGVAVMRLKLFLRNDYSLADFEDVRPVAEYSIDCTVIRCDMSETMRSILHACEPNGRGRQATLAELRRHPYFQALTSRPGFGCAYEGVNEEILYELSECLGDREGEGHGEGE
eukprot:g2254.t1